MPQYLKDEVQERIAAAALAVFARKGFHDAAVAEIARAAGISTGNIYRYYANKEALFHALVTDAFVERFLGLLRRRVDAVAAVGDVRTLESDPAYNASAAELLEFSIENRLRVIILLGRGEGTRFEGVAGQVVDELVRRAIAHFRGLRPALRLTDEMRFDLERIYRNYVDTLVHILERFEDAAAIRQAVGAYARYHLFGLTAFFEA